MVKNKAQKKLTREKKRWEKKVIAEKIKNGHEVYINKIFTLTTHPKAILSHESEWTQIIVCNNIHSRK